MGVDRKRVLREFRGYVGAYDMRDPKIALKAAHTVRVARLAEDIARADGMGDHDVDLQILIEADMLVNIYEDVPDDPAARRRMATSAGERVFRTKTGRQLLADQFLS